MPISCVENSFKTLGIWQWNIWRNLTWFLNRQCVFWIGAFYPGTPVQPVIIRYPNQFVSFCKYVIRLICVPVIKFFFLCYELETVNLKIFDYIDILCTE